MRLCVKVLKFSNSYRNSFDWNQTGGEKGLSIPGSKVTILTKRNSGMMQF